MPPGAPPRDCFFILPDMSQMKDILQRNRIGIESNPASMRGTNQ